MRNNEVNRSDNKVLAAETTKGTDNINLIDEVSHEVCALVCGQTSNANHCRELIWHTISMRKIVFPILILFIVAVLLLPSSVSNFSRKRLIKCRTVSFFISLHIIRSNCRIDWKRKISKSAFHSEWIDSRPEDVQYSISNKRKSRKEKKQKNLVDMIVGCMSFAT